MEGRYGDQDNAEYRPPRFFLPPRKKIFCTNQNQCPQKGCAKHYLGSLVQLNQHHSPLPTHGRFRISCGNKTKSTIKNYLDYIYATLTFCLDDTRNARAQTMGCKNIISAVQRTPINITLYFLRKIVYGFSASIRPKVLLMATYTTQALHLLLASTIQEMHDHKSWVVRALSRQYSARQPTLLSAHHASHFLKTLRRHD